MSESENSEILRIMIPVVTGRMTLKGTSIDVVLKTAAENISRFFEDKAFRITRVESYPGMLIGERGKAHASVEHWNVDIEFEEIRG